MKICSFAVLALWIAALGACQKSVECTPGASSVVVSYRPLTGGTHECVDDRHISRAPLCTLFLEDPLEVKIVRDSVVGRDKVLRASSSLSIERCDTVLRIKGLCDKAVYVDETGTVWTAPGDAHRRINGLRLKALDERIAKMVSAGRGQCLEGVRKAIVETYGGELRPANTSTLPLR